MKKILSALLVCALILPSLSAGAYYYKTSERLSGGLEYEERYFVTGNRNNHSYIFEYTPGLSAVPAVAYGSVYGRHDMNALGADFDNVAGGINGDFFSLRTGVPLGVIIEKGRLVSTDTSNSALGFFADGSAKIGYPQFTFALDIGGKELPVHEVNKYPSLWAVYLLTSDYGESTKSASPSTEIVIEILTEEEYNTLFQSTNEKEAEEEITDPAVKTGLTPPHLVNRPKPEKPTEPEEPTEPQEPQLPEGKALFGKFYGKVKAVYTDTFDTPIGENEIILSVDNTSAYYGLFGSVEEGEPVSLDIFCADGWQDIVTAIGGGDLILKEGEFDTALIDEESESSPQPRTAAGITEDGRVIFYAVDGRTGGTGLTLKELAYELKALGCVCAVNLDGGGSTTVMKKSYSNPFPVTANRPSDGYQRPLSTALFFLNTAEADGSVYDAAITPNSPIILVQSSFEPRSVFLDAEYGLLEVLPDTAEFYLDPAETRASLDGGVFYASQPGVVTLYYDAYFGEKLVQDKTEVYITDTLDSLETSPIRVLRGEEVSFTPKGKLNGFDVIITEAFSYSAPDAAMTDTSIFELGGIKSEVQVQVLERYQILRDFDNADGKSGYGSAFLESGEWREEIDPEFDPDALEMWIKGDFGSAKVLIKDEAGDEHLIDYEYVYDYSDMGAWSLLRAEIPMENITVTAPIIADAPVSVSAFAADYGIEREPVFFDTEGHWSAEYAEGLYNMEVITGEVWDNGEKYFFPERNLTRAEFAKMISLFVEEPETPDCEITIPDGEKEVADIPDEEEVTQNIEPIDILDTLSDLDSIPEWARQAAEKVILSGVMTGRGRDDGTSDFCPNDYITRAEVMQVFGRLLKDSESLSELTFTDLDTLPLWAEENTKKTVAAGIVTGYGDNTLRPLNPVTRGEAAAMIIRLMKIR